MYEFIENITYSEASDVSNSIYTDDISKSAALIPWVTTIGLLGAMMYPSSQEMALQEKLDTSPALDSNEITALYKDIEFYQDLQGYCAGATFLTFWVGFATMGAATSDSCTTTSTSHSDDGDGVFD